MSDDKRKVLDRIVKLINLAAKNTNEHEAKNAALLACRMMVEHRVGLRIGGNAGPANLPGDGFPTPPRPPAAPRGSEPKDVLDFIQARREYAHATQEWMRTYWARLHGEPT